MQQYMRQLPQLTKQGICNLVIILTMAPRETLAMSPASATWVYHVTRKPVNDSLKITDIRAPSLVSCSAHCSRVLGAGIFSLYYVPDTSLCQCNSGLDKSVEIPGADSLIYGVIGEAVKFGDDKTTVFPFQQDCLSLYNSGFPTDGVYVIKPGGGVTTDTWCDMTNGGWTVILQRRDGSENFTRSWTEYESGFGNRTGEYWLGLQTINKLTPLSSHLRIDMEAFPGVSPRYQNVYYGNFRVGGTASKYKLTLGGFSGPCGNPMNSGWGPGQAFSTYDQDNDATSGHCAKIYKGGWWHTGCHRSMLTGQYFQQGEQVTYARGITWKRCWGMNRSCKMARMRTRRV